jgi:hypothetical protein
MMISILRGQFCERPRLKSGVFLTHRETREHTLHWRSAVNMVTVRAARVRTCHSTFTCFDCHEMRQRSPPGALRGIAACLVLAELGARARKAIRLCYPLIAGSRPNSRIRSRRKSQVAQSPDHRPTANDLRRWWKSGPVHASSRFGRSRFNCPRRIPSQQVPISPLDRTETVSKGK